MCSTSIGCDSYNMYFIWATSVFTKLMIFGSHLVNYAHVLNIQTCGVLNSEHAHTLFDDLKIAIRFCESCCTDVHVYG